MNSYVFKITAERDGEPVNTFEYQLQAENELQAAFMVGQLFNDISNTMKIEPVYSSDFPHLYVGSKVRVKENRQIWDDEYEIVEYDAILIGRSLDTVSDDGYGDSYGVLILNEDGTAKHVMHWVDGEDCTVINNDLRTNLEFVAQNRDMFEEHDDSCEEEDEDEDEEARQFMEENKLFGHVEDEDEPTRRF